MSSTLNSVRGHAERNRWRLVEHSGHNNTWLDGHGSIALAALDDAGLPALSDSDAVVRHCRDFATNAGGGLIEANVVDSANGRAAAFVYAGCDDAAREVRRVRFGRVPAPQVVVAVLAVSRLERSRSPLGRVLRQTMFATAARRYQPPILH